VQPRTRYAAGLGKMPVIPWQSSDLPTNLSPFTDFEIKQKLRRSFASEKFRMEWAVSRAKRSKLKAKCGKLKDLDNVLFLGELIVRQNSCSML
jgi:hypothetical protein